MSPAGLSCNSLQQRAGPGAAVQTCTSQAPKGCVGLPLTHHTPPYPTPHTPALCPARTSHYTPEHCPTSGRTTSPAAPGAWACTPLGSIAHTCGPTRARTHTRTQGHARACCCTRRGLRMGCTRWRQSSQQHGRCRGSMLQQSSARFSSCPGCKRDVPSQQSSPFPQQWHVQQRRQTHHSWRLAKISLFSLWLGLKPRL